MANEPIAMPATLCSELPQPDVLLEIVNGEYRAIPRLGNLASPMASVLHALLGNFGQQHKMGLAFVESPFRLSPTGGLWRPDVAFITFDRMPASADTTEDAALWDVVPKLAAEIVRPTTLAYQIESKLDDYFHAGVQLVWVIHPVNRRIYVHESLTSVRVLVEKDELTGEPVLPGFRLPIAALFAALAKPQ